MREPKRVYVVVNKNTPKTYHLTYRSAIYEVCKLCKIPYTMRNANRVGAAGGACAGSKWYFIKEYDVTKNEFEFEEENNG